MSVEQRNWKFVCLLYKLIEQCLLLSRGVADKIVSVKSSVAEATVGEYVMPALDGDHTQIDFEL